MDRAGVSICAGKITEETDASQRISESGYGNAESGEAIDIVKKWLMQGHELDREHLVRELGDVAWYLAEAATALDVPLEAVFQGNLDKLRQRFPNGFDTGASVNRKEGDL